MKASIRDNRRVAQRPWPTLCCLSAAVALVTMLGTSAYADMYHPATNSPGGVPAQSTITSQTTVGTNTTVCWYGMQGWYSVEMSTNGGTSWQSVGRTAASDHPWCLTADNKGNGSALFRLNQNNAFVGSGACAGCHGDKFTEWKGTAHSHALATLQALHLPPAVEDGCRVCHTVGKGQPTGFIDTTNTPHLSDVGCENCHGPAGWHKYSDHDLVRPAVSIDPKICGGCHRDEHHPTFEEWSTTKHAQVNDDNAYGLNGGVYYSNTIPWFTSNLYGYYVTTNANLTLKTNPTTGIVNSGFAPGSSGYDPGFDRQATCGRCHSGATRMAMLEDVEARREKGITNALILPPAHDSALWGPTCAVCHDPHSAANRAQLRNPIWSTNYYTMPTTQDKRTILTTNFMGAVTTNIVNYNTSFDAMYNEDIQVCGQCHNSRGGRWDGRSYGFITNLFSTNAVVVFPTNSFGTNYVVFWTTNVVSSVTNVNFVSFGLQSTVSYGRAPHHSPQYNILSGNVQPDYLTGVYGTNYIGCHTLNTNGCAACHMAQKTMATPTPENPNYTGHEFDPLVPAFVGCSVAGCHDGVTTTVNPTNGIYTLQLETTNSITMLVSNLNYWAILKGTNLFGAANATKYMQNGWEYTAPGALASVTNTGPSAADQLKIPVGVRQARFNLYMVSYGKSLGIHNPAYTRYLINDASNKVWQASQ